MNISLFYFLHSFAFRSPLLDGVIWFLAVPLIYITILAVAVYLFIHYKVFKIKNTNTLLKGRGREIALIFFSTGLAYIVSDILKIIVRSGRPAAVLLNIHTLFSETDFAFPSGHSATIAALAFAVYFRHKKLGYILMIVALLIGAARVAAGVHFPIDILGGYIVGFLVAFFVKSL